MPQNIMVLDYGMGNHFSIVKRLLKFDCRVFAGNSIKEMSEADKIVLPGVGHFGKAVENIKKLGLLDALNEAVLGKQKPILGICLGMQLMAKKSEEGNTEGLGWIDAEVVKFKITHSLHYKIPHIGWNTVEHQKDAALLKNIPSNSEFYFVHAYHMHNNQNQDILGVTDYEYSFVSAIEKDNIFGVQFHPEKSHDIGNTLLENFTKL